MAKFCRNCGKSNSVDSNFCVSCGTAFNSVATASIKKPKIKESEYEDEEDDYQGGGYENLQELDVVIDKPYSGIPIGAIAGTSNGSSDEEVSVKKLNKQSKKRLIKEFLESAKPTGKPIEID